MKPFKCNFAIFIIFVMILSTNLAIAQEKKEPWTGKLGDGTEIDEEGLKRIISEHEKWLATTK